MSAILFELGETILTSMAFLFLEANGQTAKEFLLRHAKGDWGEMQECAAAMNREAVSNKGMIFSTFKLLDGTEINVKTDPGHKVTTIYLPGED